MVFSASQSNIIQNNDDTGGYDDTTIEPKIRRRMRVAAAAATTATTRDDTQVRQRRHHRLQLLEIHRQRTRSRPHRRTGSRNNRILVIVGSMKTTMMLIISVAAIMQLNAFSVPSQVSLLHRKINVVTSCPYRTSSPTAAKRKFCLGSKKESDDDEDDRRGNNGQSDDESTNLVSRMWNRISSDGKTAKKDAKKKRKKANDRSATDDDKSSKSNSGIPLVGRLFSSSNTNEDEDDDASTASSSSSSIFRAFQKSKELPLSDAEILRREVFKQQEERLKRNISDGKQQQVGRRSQLQQETTNSEIARKIEAQKGADGQRQIRLDNSKADRDSSQKQSMDKTKQKQQPLVNNDNVDGKIGRKEQNTSEDLSSSSSSVSSGRFISVVQKSIMNIFDSGDEEQWVVVAPKTRISPGECVPVTVGGIDLLLVASKDGSALHCISNSCPHLGTPLELGTLERRPIETKTTTSTGGPAASATATKSKSSVDATGSRKDDGCEDCIVCPLHRTAFALESGEVRGEWTPYPPVIGKLTGALKKQSNLAVFDVRIRGKNIEVKLNTPFDATADDDPSD